MNRGTIGFLMNNYQPDNLIHRISVSKETRLNPVQMRVTNINNKTYNLPIFKSTEGEDVVDISKLHSKANIYIGQYKILNIDEINLYDNYFAFSGIGNHKTFLSTLKEHKINVKEDLEFPDHYEYTNKDLDKIITFSKKFNSKVITTEKDYLRIDNQIKKEIQFVKSELIIIDEEKFIKEII